MPERELPIKGLRVFLVEDETLVAMHIEDMLDELGCEVAASAATLPKALEISAETVFDFALLDVNLNGERVYPVAEALVARGVPIAFSTGYGVAGIPPELSGWPVIAKPFTLDQLVNALTQAMARRA